MGTGSRDVWGGMYCFWGVIPCTTNCRTLLEYVDYVECFFGQKISASVSASSYGSGRGHYLAAATPDEPAPMIAILLTWNG